MKKISFFLLFLLLLTSPFCGVKANENDEWILIDDNGDLIAYNTIKSAKIKDSYELNDDGEFILMPIEKVVEVLNSVENIQEGKQQAVNIMPMEVPMTYWTKTFTKASESRITGAVIRISNDQLDSGSISTSKSISLTTTISSNIGIDAKFKNYGRGYLGFYPYFQKIVGTGYKKTYSQSGYLLSTESYPTTATIPLSFNGEPFGMWAVIYY